MFLRSRPFRRPTGWRNHLALAVLFALQGAITLAPLLEPSEKGRMRSHVEQQGATHRYQHDETTCAVCRVRALHSSPAESSPAIDYEHHQPGAIADAPVAPARRVGSIILPRAPPQPT